MIIPFLPMNSSDQERHSHQALLTPCLCYPNLDLCVYTRVSWKVYRLTKILSWNVTKWALFVNIFSPPHTHTLRSTLQSKHQQQIWYQPENILVHPCIVKKWNNKTEKCLKNKAKTVVIAWSSLYKGKYSNGRHGCPMVDLVIQVQILNEAICISFQPNALEKGMNLSLLSPTMGK